MSHVRRNHTRGFALLEALIALVLILVGLVAVSQLQSISLIGAGEGRARAEAAHLTQQRLEQLRNMLQKGEFTALANSVAPVTVNGVNAQFQTQWTVAAHAVPDARELRVWTTWTDSRGAAQRFDLATVVAWDESMTSAFPFAGDAGNPVAPTGGAERIAGLPDGVPKYGETNQDGSEFFRDPDSKVTYWTDGENFLMLPPKDGVAQDFTRITGRVYLDPDVSFGSAEVLVRLSSEGECTYTNTGLPTMEADGKNYPYIVYACYVGPGWYGNVGISVVNAPNNWKGVNTCVGNPSISMDGSTVSAHAQLGWNRSYRGFRTTATTSGYQSTGVMGGTQYGTLYDSDQNVLEGPSGAASYANQDFLITDTGKFQDGSKECKDKMPAALFAGNAGAYVCITPDAVTGELDRCPNAWPLVATPTGSTPTYDLTVTKTGNGAGNLYIDGVASAFGTAAQIEEDTLVVLTVTPLPGSTFVGWTNCPVINGNECTVTMTADMVIEAEFSTGVFTDPKTLTVSVSGNGKVTSAPAGIDDCRGICSVSYELNTTVTLTAIPDLNRAFEGWSGACSGNASTCVVTMTEAKSVVAAFSTTTPNCATPTVFTGSRKQAGDATHPSTVTAEPSAGASCTVAPDPDKSYSCTMNAPPNTQYVLTNRYWQGNKWQTSTKTVTTTCPGTLQDKTNF